MNSTMAWRTAGKVGWGTGPLILFSALLLIPRGQKRGDDGMLQVPEKAQ
jgi:hypothetical protein